MKYIVNANCTISIFTYVDADSQEEAKEKAKDHTMQSFCHQCSTGCPEEEWVTSGELDGEPQEITVEEREW